MADWRVFVGGCHRFCVSRRYAHLVNRTILILFMGLLSFLFGSASKAQSPEPKRNPADAGRALRQMMLTTPPAKTGEKPTKEFPRVYGILMDWPIGDQTATVFASSTGAASLYPLRVRMNSVATTLNPPSKARRR
jgi:hypothetical protein